MAHQLVLEVPEEVFEPLARIAGRTGSTPEQLAVEWLRAVSYHAAEDPLEEFIGAFPTTIPDWADQHDKYLGQTLMEELQGEKGSGS